MRKSKQYLLISTVLAIGLAKLPVAAQEASFITAPTQSISSAIANVDLERVAPQRLSSLLSRVARNMGTCQAVRRSVEQALSIARTAYDVHEDWVMWHEDCLLQRERELAELASAGENLRQAEGDNRNLEKLRQDLEALDGVLREAYFAHVELIDAYEKTQEYADLE